MGFKRMRYIVVFSIIFVVSGVILVSGSLFMVPYTVGKQTRVDKSKTWVDDTFTLMPSYNRTFNLDSVEENKSIIQVDVESSDFVVFKIISLATGKVWFERKTKRDVTSYWTSPSLGYGNWYFVFHNPSSTSVNVTARATQFFLKATEYREVTYYRSLLDPLYGYIGIIAIIAGTTLNVIHVSCEAKRRN